jgi:hypothetical protein
MIGKYLLNQTYKKFIINASPAIRTKIHPTPAKVKKVTIYALL